MKLNRILTIIFWSLFLPVLVAIIWFIWSAYNSWPRGSSGAVCKCNCRNVQQAVRGYQNDWNLNTGDPLPFKELIKAELLPRIPECPDKHSYKILGRIPASGELYLRCSDPAHIPPHEDW